MTEVAGFSPASVTWLLVLFGVGLFVGNLLGGRAADRSITVTLVSMLGALVLTMVLWALTAQFSLTAALGLLVVLAVAAAQHRRGRPASADSEDAPDGWVEGELVER